MNDTHFLRYLKSPASCGSISDLIRVSTSVFNYILQVQQAFARNHNSTSRSWGWNSAGTLKILARYQPKDHSLTHGDAIVASVRDPSLKIKNECMLNSGDGWRQKIEHTCHKHSRDLVPPMTGDDIGHCQKCKKFSWSDKTADLSIQSIAIKIQTVPLLQF